MSDEQQQVAAGAEAAAAATTTTEQPAGAQTAPNGHQPERLFTQADLDRHIADRLKRQETAFKAQQARAAEEAKAATLAEQGEFKTLYEQAQAELAKAQAELAAQARAAMLRKAAKAAGLDPDDDDLVSRLRGDDEDALTADAKKLAGRLAPAAAAAPPNLNGGGPKTLPAADAEARRRELEQRYPALKRRTS